MCVCNQWENYMNVHRPLPLMHWHERHASNKYTTATCIWHCSTTQTRICHMSTYWMTMMTLTSRTPYYAASMYTAILMAGTVLLYALVNFRNIHCAYCIHIYSRSLRLCKPAYSEPVTEPGNREGWDRKGIQRKIPWVAWLGLLSLSSVWLLQACYWLYSERREWEGTSDLPRASSITDLAEYKGSVGSCPLVLVSFSYQNYENCNWLTNYNILLTC